MLALMVYIFLLTKVLGLIGMEKILYALHDKATPRIIRGSESHSSIADVESE